MNVYIAFACVIVAWCAIYTALYLFMRQWERRQPQPTSAQMSTLEFSTSYRQVERRTPEYEGYYKSLLAELEKELP